MQEYTRACGGDGAPPQFLGLYHFRACCQHSSLCPRARLLAFFLFFLFPPGLSLTARTCPDLRRMASWKCQGMNNPPCPPLSNTPSETDRSGGIDIPAPSPVCWGISEVCVRHCFPEIHSRTKVYSAQWNKLNYTAPLIRFFPLPELAPHAPPVSSRTTPK